MWQSGLGSIDSIGGLRQLWAQWPSGGLNTLLALRREQRRHIIDVGGRKSCHPVLSARLLG